MGIIHIWIYIFIGLAKAPEATPVLYYGRFDRPSTGVSLGSVTGHRVALQECIETTALYYNEYIS